MSSRLHIRQLWAVKISFLCMKMRVGRRRILGRPDLAATVAAAGYWLVHYTDIDGNITLLKYRNRPQFILRPQPLAKTDIESYANEKKPETRDNREAKILYYAR